MRALGRLYDIGTGIVPVDLSGGANTGHRVHMRNFETLGIVFHKAAHAAGADDVVITLQEHNAASAGVSQNLAVLTKYYRKNEAAPMDGDETWTEVTQAALATITVSGAALATHQVLLYVDVEAAAMSAGFEWLSINIADPGAGGAILGTLLYIPHGLKIQRRPDLLAHPNA